MVEKSKIGWYARNLLNFFIACIRILFYCLIHPKKSSKLLFSLFSTINEFYQFSHGRLYSFETTKTYKDLKNNLSFPKSNYFSSDPNVTRPIETQVMSGLVAHLQPKTIFEIGTYNGFTTMHFAQNTPDETKIYTLDLPPNFSLTDTNETDLTKYSYDDLLVVKLSNENINNRAYHGTPAEKKITELFGSSLDYDFSPYHKKIDLIFIDGNHALKYVQSDTENAFKMLSPNGVIIWHDFDYIIHRDIFKYLNRLVKEHKIYSIPNTRFALYGPTL
ncbi:hypothetical protein MNBD_UNCLBAC01-502 [hydrothermal vent metagenome]|uniref:Class I SAM-dependent methyltransferase n=1 Tax=hydrothermal vent metagenome TaxID=652676 RepID=A0A3B1DUV6_9ZZZZ